MYPRMGHANCSMILIEIAIMAAMTNGNRCNVREG